MKKCMVSIIVVLTALAIVWCTVAPAEEQGAKRPEPNDADRPTARGARPPAPNREGQGVPSLRGLSPEEQATLKEKWQNMSEAEKNEFRAKMRERLGPAAGPTERPDAAAAIEQQIAQLKTENEQGISELREILDLARKEKAGQTAKAVEGLIVKRQKEFQQRLQAFEQRRLRLQRTRPDQPGAGQAERPARARRAPDFTLKSFDGQEAALAQLRGKIVVLEWMNFECPFSMYHYETKTTMADLAKKYKDKNVVWLAVNSTSHATAEANQEFAKKYKLPYPILDDRTGKVGKQYDAKTTPHIFIIDAERRIVYDGAIDNAPLGKVPDGEKYVNYVSDALDALVAGKPVSASQTKSYGCTVKYPAQ